MLGGVNVRESSGDAKGVVIVTDAVFRQVHAVWAPPESAPASAPWLEVALDDEAPLEVSAEVNRAPTPELELRATLADMEEVELEVEPEPVGWSPVPVAVVDSEDVASPEPLDATLESPPQAAAAPASSVAVRYTQGRK